MNESESERILEANDLLFGHGKTVVGGPISFALDRGQALVVHGANGTGKTTLLRTVLRLLPSLSGALRTPPRRQLAFLPQALALDGDLPLTTLEMVALGLNRRPRRRRARAALERVGLAHRAHERFVRLSGGQQRRVLLARAMARDSSLLGLDEPFAALDRSAADTLRGLLEEWLAEGRALVVVTHAPQQIRDLPHTALVLGEEGGPS